MLIKIILSVLALAVIWFISFIVYSRSQIRKSRVVESLVLALPKSWKELNNKQFLYVCNLMLWQNTETEIQVKCFLYFLDIKVGVQLRSGQWICKAGKKRFSIQEYEVQWFAKKLSFLTDMITEVNPLPQMAGYRHIHPRFEQAPFRQWMAAENYYQAFIYTKDEKYLNMLCAVFYSISKYNNIDVFNDNLTAMRSKLFSKIPLAERYTVFIAYSGLKHRLSEQFTYFFQKVNYKGIVESERQPPKMREHFSNMIYVLNGGNVTLTKEVLETECWSAFDTLNRKARENQEMEQRLKKMKRK